MQKSLTAAPRKPRKPKAEHLHIAYPELPDVGHTGFWLAAYLQDLARYVAMEALSAKFNTLTNGSSDSITESATYVAQRLIWDGVEMKAKYTQKEGTLLYAWPGTTYFNNPTARH